MKGRTWTEDEIDYLISFSQDPSGETTKDVAKYLGRSHAAVKVKLSKLRKAYPYVNYLEKRFSDRDVEIIKNSLRNGMTQKEIGKVLGVDEISVRNKVKHLGLNKTITHPDTLKELDGEIRRLASLGYTRQEIADRLKLKYVTIKYFVRSRKILCENAMRQTSNAQKEAHQKFMNFATRRY
ncbi:hypothetical protein [Enterococcus mediterraneensis]|uniref:hypothetical protein n=1 Tax=Enterococcus mediterraneensis TaxID=2364791 RepID=UPI000F0603D8|nr:hypothetical protein [Enterococcus mediterraneensis]